MIGPSTIFFYLSQSVVAYTDDLLCYTFLATELIAFSHNPDDYSFFAGVQFPPLYWLFTLWSVSPYQSLFDQIHNLPLGPAGLNGKVSYSVSERKRSCCWSIDADNLEN